MQGQQWPCIFFIEFDIAENCYLSLVLTTLDPLIYTKGI